MYLYLMLILVAKNAVQLSTTSLAQLSAGMPDEVLAKAAKYRLWGDTQAYLWGRYLLAEGLQKFGFDKSLLHQIQYTDYNKPYLPVSLNFNIAHSGDYILCAFSDAPIGIDIEAVRRIDIHDFTSCFTTQELATIENSSDVYQEFLRHWTIKEAVIKADGKGLSIPLDTITAADQMTVDGKTWFVHRLNIAPGYMAHLATDRALDTAIKIDWISLPLH